MEAGLVSVAGVNPVQRPPDATVQFQSAGTQQEVVQAKAPAQSQGQQPQDDAENKKSNGAQAIDEKTVIDAIERANRTLTINNNYLKFSIHSKTHQIMVKVVNPDTNEVVREIPPEKVLDMVAKMWELAGLFVDEKR